MIFEPTLAAQAANAETALRSILRGDQYDEWVASALEEGLGVCRQLLVGVQESGSMSYFSDPGTYEGILFFENKFHEKSREVLQDLERKLEQVVGLGGAAEIPAPDLRPLLEIFRELSLRLCAQDQLVERTLA
jgi:hypothetical protein